MKYIAKEKTEEELKKQSESFSRVVIADAPLEKHEWYRKEWWFCYRCKIVYSPNEIVLLRKDGDKEDFLCPQKIKRFLYREKSCESGLSYGAEEYWKRNYHLKSL